MTPTQTERLYGVRDIADAIGRPRGLVAQWHRRGKLPPADLRAGGWPFWQASTIEPWIDQQKQEAPPSS